ncbi:hypothetical protein ACJBU6_10130 [Exserohilum turcicum]
MAGRAPTSARGVVHQPSRTCGLPYHARSSITPADDNRYDFKRWLNRIGWARHLKPLKREWLLHMAKKPAHNERALSDVRWAVEMVIWRAQQVSHSSVVGMTAVMYIN